MLYSQEVEGPALNLPFEVIYELEKFPSSIPCFVDKPFSIHAYGSDIL